MLSWRRFGGRLEVFVATVVVVVVTVIVTVAAVWVLVLVLVQRVVWRWWVVVGRARWRVVMTRLERCTRTATASL